MKIWQMVIRELKYRKWNFIGGVFAVLLASVILVGSALTLAGFGQHSRNLLDQGRSELEAQVARWNDETRKDMKKLGFNIRILPEGTDEEGILSQGYSAKYMPEYYAEKLANSKLATINHLLPALRTRMDWPEYPGEQIILVGIRGELPLSHKKRLKPMETGQPVPAGKIVLGAKLYKRVGKKVGEDVILLGKKYTIHKFYDEKGNMNDLTAWIPLSEAQEMLGKQNLINEIEALDCTCATTDLGRIAAIRSEIEKCLPGTYVMEHKNKALTRAESRKKAEKAGKAALANDERIQKKQRFQLLALSLVILPLTVIVAVIWIAMLAMSNVRQRRSEIALLRAIGTPAGKIMTLFLARAGLTGLGGAIVGVMLPLIALFIVITMDMLDVPSWPVYLFPVATLIGAPLVALLAAWWPAAQAARTDPADILRGQ